jgi:FlaA1/EpsC-like NDP-sugar epimerase
MSSTESIYIVGAGGHAKVVVAMCRALAINVDGLLDENPDLRGQTVLGVPVLGPPA